MNRRVYMVGLVVTVLVTAVVMSMLLFTPVPELEPEEPEEVEEVAEPEPEPVREQVAEAVRTPEPVRTARAEARGNLLTGRITSTVGGPIAAEIVIAGKGISGHRRLRADSEGRFSIKDLPATTVKISVLAQSLKKNLERDVALRGKVHRDIKLEPVSGVAGRILDPAGRPARSAFVQMAYRGGQRTIQADATGSFSWDRPGVDLSTITVVAYSPWHAPSERTPVQAGKELVLRLGEGATIAGHVVDSRGDPVPGAAVAVERCTGRPEHDFSKRWWQPVRTDAEGAFRIKMVRPGRCDVGADSAKHGPGKATDIWTSAGTTTDNVTISLGSGGVLLGRITDRGNGKPISNAGVVVFEPGSHLPPARGVTDKDGNYRVQGIGAGRRSVRVQHRQYLTELRGGIDIPESGEATRDLTMRPRKPGERFAFQGIGATLGRNKKGVIIRNTMGNSPAAAAGLKAGDVIVGVDHEPTTKMGLSQIVERIRGEAGAPVIIEVNPPGQGRITVTVERSDVVVKGRRHHR